MKKWWLILIIVLTTSVKAGNSEKTVLETKVFCSGSWYQFIEEKVLTGDDQGHGPDVGSDEWKSVVEFKLGIRDKLDVPKRDDEAWCHYIDSIVRGDLTPSARSEDSAQTMDSVGPSFACNKVRAGSVEAMICGDEELSTLDRKLSDIYSAASSKAMNEHPPVLKAEQRGWIKGRNDCWKSDNKRECVQNGYIRRIAELQARYRLVPYSEPIHLICDANEIVVTFFQTTPSTLIAERGDSVSLMYLQSTGNGSKYQGRNETFWEHRDDVLITWGYGAPQMHCKKIP